MALESAVRNLDEYVEIPGSHLAFEGAIAKCIETQVKTGRPTITPYQQTQMGIMCKIMLKGSYTKKPFKYRVAGVEKTGYLLLVNILPENAKGSIEFDMEIVLQDQL